MNKFSKSLLIVVLVILLGLAGLIGWLFAWKQVYFCGAFSFRRE